jgi:hypothetical protein
MFHTPHKQHLGGWDLDPMVFFSVNMLGTFAFYKKNVEFLEQLGNYQFLKK